MVDMDNGEVMEVEEQQDEEGQMGCVDEKDEEFSMDNQVMGSDRWRSRSLKRSNSDKEFDQGLQSFRKKPHLYSRCGGLVLAFQTLGVVYGDIGTSPLYVYSSTGLQDPQEEDFLGAMSIMLWTITLISLVKYVFIVLWADDHGEGGSFSVYSKLCQHATIGQTAGRQFIPLRSDADLEYHGSMQKGRGGGCIHDRAKSFLEGSKLAQRVLLGMVMTGTSMIMGDGVLTPAISVLSAVSGIKSAPGAQLSQEVVVGLSAAILVLMFALQRFGTSKVAGAFSPIMATWFLANAALGIYNVCMQYPGVFKAASPHYIVVFFLRNGVQGWKTLSGMVLVIAGSEAMFWDLGHFNQTSIQRAFAFLVYPSLLITYMGQTAFCIKHPASVENAFWDSIPHKLYWPMLVVATLAAIVASQALISATFCVFKQTMALGCFPRVQMVNTSEEEEGQVYCPAANYALMVLCLAVVLGFQDGNKIASAYGIAVLFDLLITTCLVTLVMLLVWRTHWVLALVFFSAFITIETTYLSSVLIKVIHGGWVPFAIATTFLCIMLVWTYGRHLKHSYEVQHRITPTALQLLLNDAEIHRVPGVCFFYMDLLDGPPPVFTHYLHNVGSLHHILVFTTIRFIPIKTVLPSERYVVGRVVGCAGVYRCVVRYGYRDTVNEAEQDFIPQVIHRLKEYLHTHLSSLSSAPEDLQQLEAAAAQSHDAVCVIGKAKLQVSENVCWWKRMVGNHFYYLLQHNCRSTIADLHVRHSNLLEVGMVYDWTGD